LLAAHALFAYLLLLACSVLAMLWCACLWACYAMLYLLMGLLVLTGMHTCLSRCTVVPQWHLWVPVVLVKCFCASWAS
jgi:hypothetical protein